MIGRHFADSRERKKEVSPRQQREPRPPEAYLLDHFTQRNQYYTRPKHKVVCELKARTASSCETVRGESHLRINSPDASDLTSLQAWENKYANTVGTWKNGQNKE